MNDCRFKPDSVVREKLVALRDEVVHALNLLDRKIELEKQRELQCIQGIVNWSQQCRQLALNVLSTDGGVREKWAKQLAEMLDRDLKLGRETAKKLAGE